jgi:hypothetical protein
MRLAIFRTTAESSTTKHVLILASSQCGSIARQAIRQATSSARLDDVIDIEGGHELSDFPLRKVAAFAGRR